MDASRFRAHRWRVALGVPWRARRGPAAVRCLGLTLAVVALSACAPQNVAVTASASLPEVVVRVEDGRFVPDASSTEEGIPTIAIPVGTTVRWENVGNLGHTATQAADGFPLDEPLFDIALEPGEAGTHTFAVAGRYEVMCVPHPTMQLVVTVE